MRCGWEFQLQSLRHYLERHAGKERTVARLRRTLRTPLEGVWTRLVRSNGLFSNDEGGLIKGRGFGHLAAQFWRGLDRFRPNFRTAETGRDDTVRIERRPIADLSL